MAPITTAAAIAIGSTAESALEWARETCVEAQDYTVVKEQQQKKKRHRAWGS